MSLVVNTASTQTSLVEVEMLRERLGLDQDKDNVLQEICDEITSQIHDYLRRDLRQQTYVETLKGTGRRTLVLSQAPVVSITSITLDGTVDDSDNYSILDAQAGILWRDNGWLRTSQLFTTLSSDVVPGTEEYDWVVTYVAGYRMPGEDPAASEFALPLSLRRQAILAAQFAYATYRRDPSVVLRQAEDLREEYAATRLLVGDSGLPVAVERSLNAWRFVN